jgi:DNA mismatch repair protein MutL
LSKIVLLDSTTIDKIAAGEVVERPASVVKELVENALDAGASRVEIEIQNGGQTSILVQDNGLGMTAEEAELAIQRHATSKLRNADDLFRINSLGFRGEALPSIASVSKMTLRTKALDAAPSAAGAELVVHGGKVIKNNEAAVNPGTTILVEDLFYNVPARLKFLKTPATELGHITTLISKFILARPTVAFALSADHKTIVRSPGSKAGDTAALQTAATIVLGAGIAKKMRPFENYSSAVKIEGLLASPQDTKSDRNSEFFFVNGRVISSIALSKALEEALRDKIPRGRFPVCIMLLTVKPDELDVNIHPTKREVKFLRQNEIFNAVLHAVKHTLDAPAGSLSAVEISSRDPYVRMQAQHMNLTEKNVDEQHSLLRPEEMRNAISAQASAMDASFASFREGLYPVAQVNKTYIVALDGEDLVLVDQHVAHERILYEQLLRKNRDASVQQQELLLPETIELTPAQFQSLVEIKDTLLAAGFHWEDFGGTTLLLRGVPACLTRQAPRQTFLDIIDEVLAHGAAFSPDKKQEEILKMVACKAAIKAGEVLTIIEMRGLLRDLSRTSNAETCPHGRPIVVPITKEELDKKFGR